MPALSHHLQKNVAQAEKVIARIVDLVVEVDPYISIGLAFYDEVIGPDFTVMQSQLAIIL